jgi:hypothetical protein
MVDRPDLELLAAADELRQRRLRVPATRAWEAVHGQIPTGRAWVALRLTVLRLEGAGLVQSDDTLAIEVTDAGRHLLASR